MIVEKSAAYNVTMSEYERKQVIEFLGGSSGGSRKESTKNIYDDNVLEKLYDLLVDFGGGN